MQNLGKIIVFLLLTQFIALGDVLSDKEFSLTLHSTQKKVYVGESFEVILLFKEKNDAQAVDSDFFAPVFKGFWLKNTSKPQKIKEEKYSTTKIIYTIAPQRVGDMKVSHAEIHIAKSVKERDKWGVISPEVQWKTYPSNDLDIEAIALPSGVDLVGRFSISAKVENLKVNAGEALSLILEVQSSGNLEDIDSFKPSIDGVNIIDKEIVIEGNTLTQKILFVGNNDFTIAPFVLKYFDPLTKKIKTIATKEMHIKVKDAKIEQELIIKSEIKKPKEIFASSSMIGIYILGLVSGVLLMLSKPWNLIHRKKSVSLKQPKTLLVKLLPHISDADVQSMIDDLEKNIYLNDKVQINKKSLKNIMEKYSID